MLARLKASKAVTTAASSPCLRLSKVKRRHVFLSEGCGLVIWPYVRPNYRTSRHYTRRLLLTRTAYRSLASHRHDPETLAQGWQIEGAAYRQTDTLCRV